jgi:hypothetical protein
MIAVDVMALSLSGRASQPQPITHPLRCAAGLVARASAGSVEIVAQQAGGLAGPALEGAAEVIGVVVAKMGGNRFVAVVAFVQQV